MRNYLYGISAFCLAFAVLGISVLRYSFVPKVYGFTANVSQIVAVVPTPIPEVVYTMPYPGKILPDNWLWFVKAARDRILYIFASNSLRRADLALLYSDKRLGASRTLFENNKPDLAVSVLTKGEKYLEIAYSNEQKSRNAGGDTKDFLLKLATASLKHRQIIEQDILPYAPEDLKPGIVKTLDYSKNTYKFTRDALNSLGIAAPKDPFNGQ